MMLLRSPKLDSLSLEGVTTPATQTCRPILAGLIQYLGALPGSIRKRTPNIKKLCLKNIELRFHEIRSLFDVHLLTSLHLLCDNRRLLADVLICLANEGRSPGSLQLKCLTVGHYLGRPRMIIRAGDGCRISRKACATGFCELVRDWTSRPIAVGPMISNVKRLIVVSDLRVALTMTLEDYLAHSDISIIQHLALSFCI